jgi:hypothetical protein
LALGWLAGDIAGDGIQDGGDVRLGQCSVEGLAGISLADLVRIAGPERIEGERVTARARVVLMVCYLVCMVC